MDIVNFVWGAMAGGTLYDGVKTILGGSFNILDEFFQEDKKDEFESHLKTIFSVNEKIEQQLIALKEGKDKNINSNNIVIQKGNNNRNKIG